MAKKEIIPVADSCEIQSRTIKNFLNTEIKDFATYVVQNRAVPNIMDGLRVGARKLLYAALIGDLKNGKKDKLQALTGDALKLAYHHGDASLYSTVVSLSSKHLFNIAPLEVLGQIGTLRVPDVTTAARYLSIRHSQYIDIFKADWDLLVPQEEDGKAIEPKFLLPIIPVQLLWRTNSPGFGFSYRCFSYDLNDVIDATLEAVRNGSCDLLHHVELRPRIEGIKEENLIWHNEKQCWYNVGEYTFSEEEDWFCVKELPFDITYKSYEEHLQKLKESYYILDYVNRSMNGQINYLIRFPKGRLKLLMSQKIKFFNNLKLFSRIKSNTLNAIDTNGKSIIHFDTPQQLIDCFVRKRLHFYDLRKSKTIESIKLKIEELSYKAMFIDLVINDKLIINKRPIADIKADLDKYKLPYDVLKMSVYNLTKEKYEELLKEIADNKYQLEYITNTSIQDMYIDDLIELKKKYCSELYEEKIA